jgi:hypothetical protein
MRLVGIASQVCWVSQSRGLTNRAPHMLSVHECKLEHTRCMPSLFGSWYRDVMNEKCTKPAFRNAFNHLNWSTYGKVVAGMPHVGANTGIPVYYRSSRACIPVLQASWQTVTSLVQVFQGILQARKHTRNGGTGLARQLHGQNPEHGSQTMSFPQLTQDITWRSQAGALTRRRLHASREA